MQVQYAHGKYTPGVLQNMVFIAGGLKTQVVFICRFNNMDGVTSPGNL